MDPSQTHRSPYFNFNINILSSMPLVTHENRVIVGICRSRPFPDVHFFKQDLV